MSYRPISENPPSPARPLHLLVIENHEPTRLFVQHVLQDTYRLTMVSQASAAKEEARKTRFDGILVDIALQSPHDGIEVMKYLRALDDYAEVPLVAMTAYAMPGDEDRFLNAGFDAYISKPFVRSEIVEVLRSLLEQERTP